LDNKVKIGGLPADLGQ